MLGQRHLVECHCVLPIYKNKKPTVYHKFVVYSKIDDNTGKVIPKYVNCNNCGITHCVFELCRSDIIVGKEEINSVRKIEDFKISLDAKIYNLLQEYFCNIDVYEEVEEIFEKEIFPRTVVLKREIIDEKHSVKILEIKNNTSFKIIQDVISNIIV